MGRLQDKRRAAEAVSALLMLLAASGAVADTLAIPAATQPLAVSQPPPALGVRFGGDAARTRLVLDLGLQPPGRVVASPDGARLTLDVAVSGAQAGTGRGRGLVTGWTLEPEAAGARMSLDLSPGTRVQKRFFIPPSADNPRWRYVVDLVAGDPLAALAETVAAGGPTAPPADALAHPSPPPTLAAPAPPGASSLAASSSPAPARLLRQRGALAAPAAASPASPPVTAARSLAVSSRAPVVAAGRPMVIVIDAGHGGHDTGARSLVRNEKDINLAAALALRARLQRNGRYRVVLTRSDDTFVPLDERVRIARAAKADLFISLHSDSAGQDPTPHGASVYTVSDHGVTRVGEVLGQHEWFTRAGDRRADPGVGKILLDLTQRSTRNRSAEFAGLLVDHVGQSVDMLPHGHRDASYFVLLAPDVPAVLLEMGFITNPADELRLTDPDQRQTLMDRVGDAIDDYFTPHRVIAER